MQREFEVHRLNEDGLRAMTNIASQFCSLLHNLEIIAKRDGGSNNQECGRLFEICRQKLEESCFYMKKSIAQIDDYNKELES